MRAAVGESDAASDGDETDAKKRPSRRGNVGDVTGANFSAPVTVKFGEASATGVTVNSSTSITATAPAETIGTVNVTVTTAAGTSAVSKKDLFKFKAK